MREKTILGPSGLEQFFLSQNGQFLDFLLYIEIHTMYLSCEYQLNLTYNEWLIGDFVLANQMSDLSFLFSHLKNILHEAIFQQINIVVHRDVCAIESAVN